MVSTQVHRGQPRLHNVPQPTNHLHRLEDVRKYTTTLQASKQNKINNKIRNDFFFFHFYFAHSMVIAHAHSWSTFKLVGKTLWIKKQKNKRKKSTMRTYYDGDSANLLNSCLVIIAMMLSLSLSLSHQNASKVNSSKASYE